MTSITSIALLSGDEKVVSSEEQFMIQTLMFDLTCPFALFFMMGRKILTNLGKKVFTYKNVHIT